MPDNETIEERARDFILSRTRYATEYAAEMYGKDFAEFATIEREKAVREFIEKLNSPLLVDVDFDVAARDVIREMFGR
jgi:hypothetical protein